MINSHPSLSKICAAKTLDFDPLDGAFRSTGNCSQRNENANPAQKSRFIKPNKTGDPKPLESCPAIAATAFRFASIALLKCRESCLSATTKMRMKMNAICALVLLGFAALAAVLIAAVGIDRGAKAIDRDRCDDDDALE